MAVTGFFVSKSGMLLMALCAFILIPTMLIKSGVENWYTSFFGNPFTAFVVIFLIGIALLHRYIRSNIVVALIFMSGIAVAAYLYVYTLLI